MSETCDVWIRGASVYDGSGAAPRVVDVALRGERIAHVGARAELHAGVSLDAGGLALAPGFIDVHTHDDFALIAHPEMDFKVLGGVTTCVVGNCGMGAAPASSVRRKPFAIRLSGSACRQPRTSAIERRAAM